MKAKIFGLITKEIGSGLLPLVDTCKRDGLYKSAVKSLARPISRYILFDGENISFETSLVIYIYIYIYIHIYK